MAEDRIGKDRMLELYTRLAEGKLIYKAEEAEHYTKEKVLGTKETEQMGQTGTEGTRRFPRIDTYYTCLHSMQERFDLEFRQTMNALLWL